MSMDIANELDKAESLIVGARRLLAGGQMVELSALQDRIGALTDAIKTAPREDGLDHRDALVALVDSLDVLERELELHRQSLSAGLDALDRKKAREAYVKDDD